MVKTTEEVCLYYIAYGLCQKGRSTGDRRYCQTCDEYCPVSRGDHGIIQEYKGET